MSCWVALLWAAQLFLFLWGSTSSSYPFQQAKVLGAPYRLALTGTPLENKLEDLYSIVQLLDQYLLGPLYLLLYRHQVKDESRAVRGYLNLQEVDEKLKGVMIRRRKRDVLKQLPQRIDQQLLVPMTAQQMELHNSYDSDVALLVAKWRKMGFLNEKDRRRLLSCLNLMRMSCNSTYLVDQHTRYDTKIDELFYILEKRLAEAVLDTAEDSVFMSDRKFKEFMENLEKVKETRVPEEAPAEPSSDANMEKAPTPAGSEEAPPRQRSLI